MSQVAPDLALRVMQAMLDTLRGLFDVVIVEYETIAQHPQPCKRCGLLIEPGQVIQRVKFASDVTGRTYWVHRDCKQRLEEFMGAQSD